MERLILIEGPCVVESKEITLQIAREVMRLSAPFVRAEDMEVRHKVKVLDEDDGWVCNFSRSHLKK